jgi:hypothetical protein
MIRNSENGQVGLVVLLITVVMLTVGVSVASRSVSDLKLTRQEQESTRALDIAESGIEDALSQDLSSIIGSTTGNIPSGEQYSLDVSANTTLDTQVEAGHTAEIKLLANPPVAGTFTITMTGACASALEVAVIRNATTVNRQTFDCDGARRAVNGFSPGPYVVTYTNTDQIARIKVLYAGTTLTVTGANLPTQSYTIRSTTTVNGATRAVEVTKPLAALPSIFDYVLFSGTDLIKN